MGIPPRDQSKVPNYSEACRLAGLLPLDGGGARIVDPGSGKTHDSLTARTDVDFVRYLRDLRRVRPTNIVRGDALLGRLLLVPPREWPTHPAVRTSLSAIVTPEDSTVRRMVRSIRNREPATLASGRERTLGFLSVGYSHLKDRVVYDHPPDVDASGCQTIREPRQILPRNTDEPGMGNCLDLSVLFASYLESVGESPVMVLSGGMNEAPTSGHAAVACWLDPPDQPGEPLLTWDQLAVAIESGRMVLLESTGVCRKPDVTHTSFKPLPFEQALVLDLGRERRILPVGTEAHGIDIRACRSRGMSSLSGIADPHVRWIFTMAEEMAEGRGTDLETIHLLHATLVTRGDVIRATLESGRLSLDRTAAYAESRLQKSQPSNGEPKETSNYETVKERAVLRASLRLDEIREHDLIWAFLGSTSKDVEWVLQGLRRREAEERLLEIDPHPPIIG